MRRADDPAEAARAGGSRGPGSPQEEAAWAGFEASLRDLPIPEPASGLRARCLPGGALGPKEGGRCRILAVDDEPNILRLIRIHLEEGGYQVETAADGETALRCVAAAPPDLIVLDVMMPGPDGFQVLRRLKDDPATAEIPIVMLTARSTDDDIRQGWQQGADFYMPKPFNPHELRAVVDRMVAVLGTPENPPPLRRWLK